MEQERIITSPLKCLLGTMVLKEYCYLDGGFETWKDLGKPVEMKDNEPRPAKFDAKTTYPRSFMLAPMN